MNNLDGLGTLGGSLDKLVVNLLVHIHATSSNAALSGIEEQTQLRLLNGQIDIGI